MSDSLSPREMRLSSTARGLIIGALVLFHVYLMRVPGASLTVSLLIAAGLQAGVVVVRRFVSRENQPMALYVLELLVDAGTVLLFAIGVFGGILRAGLDA